MEYYELLGFLFFGLFTQSSFANVLLHDQGAVNQKTLRNKRLQEPSH